MSYQVGLLCYATLPHAGQAACTNFVPITSFTDGATHLRTVSCQSASTTSGALQLKISTTSLDGTNSAVFSTVEQNIAFPDCQYQQYVDASELIAGALLACFFSAYGLWKIRSYLDWSRGDA